MKRNDNLEQRVAEYLELDGKRTPGPLTLTRYAHGGGRLSFAPDTEHRTLVADFYHEGDREFYTASANLAPAIIREQKEEIERLREAIRELLTDTAPFTEVEGIQEWALKHGFLRLRTPEEIAACHDDGRGCYGCERECYTIANTLPTTPPVGEE